MNQRGVSPAGLRLVALFFMCLHLLGDIAVLGVSVNVWGMVKDDNVGLQPDQPVGSDGDRKLETQPQHHNYRYRSENNDAASLTAPSSQEIVDKKISLREELAHKNKLDRPWYTNDECYVARFELGPWGLLWNCEVFMSRVSDFEEVVDKNVTYFVFNVSFHTPKYHSFWKGFEVRVPAEQGGLVTLSDASSMYEYLHKTELEPHISSLDLFYHPHKEKAEERAKVELVARGFTFVAKIRRGTDECSGEGREKLFDATKVDFSAPPI